MDESVKTHLLKSPDKMTKERRQIKEFSWVHVELQVGNFIPEWIHVTNKYSNIADG